ENGEGIEGRLDSISQVYAQRRTPVSHTYLFGPGIWVPKMPWEHSKSNVLSGG
ncbi:hypothetical protein ALC56_03919, partial [Trachymyrmex septentrionalis]